MERENIEKVWERVNARALPPAAERAGERETVHKLLQSIRARQQGYEWLSRRSSDCRALAAPALRALREAEEEWQTEFFLLTGDSCALRAAQEQPAGVLSALGGLYHKEQEAAALFRRLADSLPERQRKLALRQADQAEERCEAVRERLRRALR